MVVVERYDIVVRKSSKLDMKMQVIVGMTVFAKFSVQYKTNTRNRVLNVGQKRHWQNCNKSL